MGAQGKSPACSLGWPVTPTCNAWATALALASASCSTISRGDIVDPKDSSSTPLIWT